MLPNNVNINEVFKSKGYKVSKLLDHLELLFIYYDKNYSVIEEFIDNILDDKEAFSSESYLPQSLDLSFGLDFLNFVNCAGCLRDFELYRLKDFIIKDQKEFEEIYLKNVKRIFGDSVCADFFHNLRNYVCHYDIPPVSLNFDVYEKQEERSLLLNLYIPTKPLLRSGKFCKKCRDFFKDRKYVDLVSLIHDYYDMTETFYNWISSEIKEIYKEDLSIFNSYDIDLELLQSMESLSLVNESC